MMGLKVKEVAEIRGFKNAKALADALGKSYNSIYPIWNNQARRIDLDTLDQLCVLLKVQPGLLFEHMADIEDKPLPSARKRGKKR